MAGEEKIDLFRQLKDRDYLAAKKPAVVDVGKAAYLSIEGRGAPGGEEFNRKIGALYGAAYTVKMSRKFSGAQDYVVGKLEAQWWAEGESGNFSAVPPEQWLWRLMIRVPDFIGRDELERAADVLLEKGKDQEVREVKLRCLEEGRCVQMLHVGPYDREGETVGEMTRFAEAQGLSCTGPHHEIYISDPRRVPPERLKTILRLPVREASR